MFPPNYDTYTNFSCSNNITFMNVINSEYSNLVDHELNHFFDDILFSFSSLATNINGVEIHSQ